MSKRIVLTEKDFYKIYEEGSQEKGRSAWNKWKKSQVDTEIIIRANLRGEVFSEYTHKEDMDFDGVSFESCDLYYVRFYYCTFKGASFARCNMEGIKIHNSELVGTSIEYCVMENCRIIRCNLIKATLDEVDLSRADLEDVNLAEATIEDTKFNRTGFSNVSMYKAFMGSNFFSFTDISRIKGLETVEHNSYSSIGVECLYYFGEDLPLLFLSNTGIPENLLEQLPYLVIQKPINFYECMISYSHQDTEFVNQLIGSLKNSGVGYWIDREEMKGGARIRSRMEKAVRKYDKVIVVISKNSLNSPWVENEVEAVFERERQENSFPDELEIEEIDVLIPVVIDDAILTTKRPWAATIRRERKYRDFTQWRDYTSMSDSFAQLLLDLKKS